jgi:hypothetical protein
MLSGKISYKETNSMVAQKIAGLFAVVSLVASILMVSTPALAMQLKDFDKLQPADQGRYVKILFEGTIMGLSLEAKDDMVQKFRDYFYRRTVPSGISVGLNQLTKNLRSARIIEQEDNKKFNVEDIYEYTLYQFGIDKPKNLASFTKDFRPQGK